MSLYQEFDMQHCDRCGGSRPHSKAGKCMALHRTSLQRTASTGLTRTPLKSVSPKRLPAIPPTQQNDCGCTTICQTGCILFGPCPPRAPRLKIVRPTKAAKPRRTYDQTLVRAAVAALLAGQSTLQQAARDVGCDTDYLHLRAWKAAKDATSKRDDGRCQYPDCGSEGWAKDTHHRITKGSGGSSNPLVAYYLPNLITLCRTHHTHVTVNPKAGEELGLVIPRLPPIDPATIPAMTIHGLTLLWPDGERTIIQPDQEAS